jgi:hypothetical protein
MLERIGLFILIFLILDSSSLPNLVARTAREGLIDWLSSIHVGGHSTANLLANFGTCPRPMTSIELSDMWNNIQFK